MLKYLRIGLLVLLTSSSMYSCNWASSDGYLYTLSDGEQAMLIELFPNDADAIQEGKLTKEHHDAWYAHRCGCDYVMRTYSRLQPEITDFLKIDNTTYLVIFTIDGEKYTCTVTQTKDELLIDCDYVEKE